jgi:steroid delta-isomerase
MAMTETDARAFLTRYFDAATQGTDFDAFAALFTEDAVLEDPVGTPPVRGRTAIRDFLAAGRAHIERSTVTLHEVKACGDEAAARWSIAMRMIDGRELAIDGIGVFVFADPGTLRHVREFWDAAALVQLFAGLKAS